MLHTIILILHVLGASILFSTGVFSLLITTKGPVTKERLKTMAIFSRLAPMASLWQLATGIILYLYASSALNLDPIFWLKIALFVTSGFLAGNIIKKKKIALLKQKGEKVKVGNLPFLIILELLITIAIISIGVTLVVTI